MADWLIHSFIDRLTDWVIEWLADLRMYELSIEGLLHRLLDCWSIDERLQLNDWRLVSDRFGNAGFIEWRLPSGYARRMWPGWMLIFKLQCSCRCLREVWRHVESCRVNIQGAFRSLSSSVIDACAICGDLGQAAEWLSKAQEAGLNANIISHKIQCQHLRAMPRLGVGCCVFFQSAGDWAEA